MLFSRESYLYLNKFLLPRLVQRLDPLVLSSNFLLLFFSNKDHLFKGVVNWHHDREVSVSLTWGKPSAKRPSPVRVTRGTADKGLRNLHCTPFTHIVGHLKHSRKRNPKSIYCNLFYTVSYLATILHNPKKPMIIGRKDATINAPWRAFIDSLNLLRKIERKKQNLQSKTKEKQKAISRHFSPKNKSHLMRVNIEIKSSRQSYRDSGNDEGIRPTNHYRQPGSEPSL